jgi:flagellar M-ring protein FliF
MLREGEHKVLFANLEREGRRGGDRAKLDQLNVPYVRRRRRHHHGAGGARLRTAHEAQRGRPANKGSIAGYELLDGSGFGQTDGQQRVQLKRALEGELTRTIQSLASRCRRRACMLALPQPERLLPRAAEAHRLGDREPAPRPHARARADRRHRAPGGLQRARDADQGGQRGRRQRRAAVAAATTPPRRLRLAAAALPEARSNPPPASAWSSCSSRWSGATTCAPPSPPRSTSRRSNRPPRSSSPTRATPRPPCAPAQRGESQADPPSPAACPAPPATSRRCRPPRRSTARRSRCRARRRRGANGSARREAETNYAVDKTVRVTRNATGTVRRLHAAVVVNHRMRAPTPRARPPADPADRRRELEKLTALVQQGIGFNPSAATRCGWSTRRSASNPCPGRAVPFYMQPWVQDLLRAGAAPARWPWWRWSSCSRSSARR